ncbi:unnamed protein product, partial [Ectocarpus sp. 13 AM-2016]
CAGTAPTLPGLGRTGTPSSRSSRRFLPPGITLPSSSRSLPRTHTATASSTSCHQATRTPQRANGGRSLKTRTSPTPTSATGRMLSPPPSSAVYSTPSRCGTGLSTRGGVARTRTGVPGSKTIPISSTSSAKLTRGGRRPNG